MIHPCLQVLASGVITDDALVAAGPPGDPSVESLRVSGSGKHDSLFLCLYLKMSGTFVHINLCVYSSHICLFNAGYVVESTTRLSSSSSVALLDQHPIIGEVRAYSPSQASSSSRAV